MTDAFTPEKRACLEALAAIATLKGNPTPREFEAFWAALSTFQPLPPDLLPEDLLTHAPDLATLLPQITTPDLQQQVYRSAHAILRSQGITDQEAVVLTQLETAFQIDADLAKSLLKQPLVIPQAGSLMNSALAGITSLMGRDGEVRRLIWDYALGAAIVGLIPLNGGGMLEIKLLVILGLILKMTRDIRQRWGNPHGQDWLAVISSGVKVVGAILIGGLAWVTVTGLGLIIPYVGAIAKAAGFATVTWLVGQAANQFYTSPNRPDLAALKRAFPNLMPDQAAPAPRRSQFSLSRVKRRQLLLGGLAASTTVTLGVEQVRRSRAAAQQAAIEAYTQAFYNPDDVIATAITGDVRMVAEFQEIQAAAAFPPPPLPYRREISKRLILLSRLATQQYITGRNDPTYDGNLQQLPDYLPDLDAYRLVTNFRGEERQVNDKIELQVPQAILDDPTLMNDPTALDEALLQTEEIIRTGITSAVKIGRKLEVFYGFLLESDEDSILVFRGTQQTGEWLGNLYAVQQDYLHPTTGESLGRIHGGFRRISDTLVNPRVLDAVQQISPNKPCYVSGHSLGAALATLIALDLALAVPALQPQLQVYAYAGPRVGDPEFARTYARVLPNSFRITNLADPIPTMPPTKLQSEFVHVGENWSFLTQAGDILPNHIVDTYRRAIAAEAETNQPRTFPSAGLM